MLAIFVVLPLLLSALAALVFYEQNEKVKYVALGASVFSLLIAIVIFFSPPGTQVMQWFKIGSVPVNITTVTAPLNLLMLMIVSIITPLIFLYSFGFMELPSEHPRFFFEMSLFAAAMMLFAISGSFITMLIGWEFLGITSYLLIGFWYDREKAPTAARKAITTILIGDIAMFAAIILIGVSYNGFDFSAVLGSPVSSIYLKISLILIAIAAFTKSAQFPFHEWLSDAMEGPTPVSAFLHSSTMVKAGVFLVMVLLPLYSQQGLLPLLLWIGLISSLVGVSNALAERHIKKILAYSTIEDLGLMFVALGLDAPVAAAVLFFVQSFYKALVFMGAGAVMRANEGREDIFHIYGTASNKPLFYSMAIGALSIAAIFPTSGFFGKGMVESAAFSTNIFVYIILLVIALGTSIYVFRWLLVPSRKNAFEDEKDGSVNIYYNAMPKTMLMPIFLLAAAVLAATLLYSSLPSWLSAATGAAAAQISASDAVVGTIISIIGIAVAFWLYKMGNRVYLASKNRILYSLLYNSTIVNAIYIHVTNISDMISRALSYVDFAFDRSIYALSILTVSSGYLGRKIINGQTNTYVLAFVLGLLALVVIFG